MHDWLFAPMTMPTWVFILSGAICTVMGGVLGALVAMRTLRVRVGL